MIEALFKKNILLILVVGILFCENTNNIPTTMLPLELSQTTFGIQLFNNEQTNNYFKHQSWITNNLSVNGFISPSFNNTIDITYGFNIGYSSIFENEYLKNIIYSTGYFRKKFTSEGFRVSSFSVQPIIKINDKNWLTLSINYLFNNKGDDQINNFLSFAYIKSFKKFYIISPGIQVQKNNNKIKLNYNISFNYSL